MEKLEIEELLKRE